MVYDMKGYKKQILILSDMLELGENERKFHFNVGEKINRDKIDCMICIEIWLKKFTMGQIEILMWPNFLLRIQ